MPTHEVAYDVRTPVSREMAPAKKKVSAKKSAVITATVAAADESLPLVSVVEVHDVPDVVAVENELQPQIILHLPHASDASMTPYGLGAADGGGGGIAPAPIGDDALGLMQSVSSSNATSTVANQRVMDGFEAAWPRSTVHACWWCCHPFDGIPVGLPLRHAAGIFHCTGIFCGLECALAFNRRERHGHDADDTSNHIQLMAMRMGRTAGSIRPAPDRSLLRMFGGPLTVDEFRAVSVPASERALRLHLPPVQAVVPAVEEISTATAGASRRADQRIPLDLARIRRAGERTVGSAANGSRGVRGARNTLEAAMPNLRIVGAPA